MMIPAPYSLREGVRPFRLGPETGVASDDERVLGILSDRFGQGVIRPAERPGLRFERDASLRDEDESYTITHSDGHCLVRGGGRGLLHGAQTLCSLASAQQHLAPFDLPVGTITDRPRVGWRASHWDVCRHFVPIEYLYRHIDILAALKINIFHFHLTDDQGWRIEIEGYPRLTEVAAFRHETRNGPAGEGEGDGIPHGGFYTQRQLTDLVAYATSRGVTIMPEFELPGHAQAAIAAYPELGNFPERAPEVWTDWGVSEEVFSPAPQTMEFLREVLRQIMAIFPSPYIHLGGDECPSVQWETSPAAAEVIAREGLAGPERVHSWILGQMCQFVLDAGRTPVCWDEASGPGDIPGEAIIMVWRDPKYAVDAVDAGHRIVMSPHRRTYLDYPQSRRAGDRGAHTGTITTTVRSLYEFDPLAVPERCREYVLGSGAQLWTEHLNTVAEMEYMLFPRLLAFAETMWHGAGDYREFHGRLVVAAQQLAGNGITVAPIPRA